jgi:hypothetical protein
MQTIQDRLAFLLRAYRTIRFCDACLALKMGAFPREVREAVVMIGDGFQISSGKCSECLQEKTVVRALAAWPDSLHRLYRDPLEDSFRRA